MTFTPDALAVVVLTVVVAAGSFIQSNLGFGLNLLLTPLALLFFPGVVPIPALIANGVLSTAVAWQHRSAIDRRFLTIATITSVPGVIGGLLLLLTLPQRALAIFGGIVVLIGVLLQVVAPRPRDGIGLTIGAGVFSGLLASTTSVTGPPIALVLARHAPVNRRATVAAAGALLTGITLLCLGLLEPGELVNNAANVLWLIPGLVIGVIVQHFVGHRLSPTLQRVSTLIVAAVAAAILIVRAIVAG